MIKKIIIKINRKVEKLILPPSKRISKIYKQRYGFFPDLQNPKRFSEKLQIRKLHNKEIYTKISDKIEVKNHLQNNGYNSLIIPTYKVYNKLYKGFLDDLPNSFVIKTNHYSGDTLVVFDKNDVKESKIVRKYNKLLKKIYAEHKFESQYHNIERKIIVEELMVDVNGEIPKDYKFHCFNNNGNFDFYLQVDYNRFGEHKKNYYNSKLEFIEVRENNTQNSFDEFIKPDNFEELVIVAKKLSKDFAYIRVDLYQICGKIYFGEYTLTPASGFLCYSDDDFDYKLGALWEDFPN